MFHRNRRRIEPKTSGVLDLLYIFSDDLVTLSIAVLVCSSYIYGKAASIGNHMCNFPALITVTVIFTSPKASEVFGTDNF